MLSPCLVLPSYTHHSPPGTQSTKTLVITAAPSPTPGAARSSAFTSSSRVSKMDWGLFRRHFALFYGICNETIGLITVPLHWTIGAFLAHCQLWFLGTFSGEAWWALRSQLKVFLAPHPSRFLGTFSRRTWRSFCSCGRLYWQPVRYNFPIPSVSAKGCSTHQELEKSAQ